MKFSQLLSKYCQDLSCTNIELSKRSNLDPSLISRIKNGKKGTNIDKQSIETISNALIELANDKKIIDFPKDIKLHLENALKEEKKLRKEKQALFSNNFDLLLKELNVKNNHIANYLVVDPSYISRIRNNKRKPYIIDQFIDSVCKYLLKYYFNDEDLKIYRELLNYNKKILAPDLFTEKMKNWLINNNEIKKNSLDILLREIDKYQIKKIVKDKMFLGEVKSEFILPKNRRYYGVEETKQAILDFYALVINNDKTSDIIVYNDFPLNIYWDDTMFIKKWLLYMQIAIEKGNRIYKIHYLNESTSAIFDEINTWLPLFMSGMVKPYYLEKQTHTVSSSLLLVATNLVAIIGESTVDDNSIMTRLTKIEEEVKYYEAKSRSFLKIAKPLTQIFFKQDENEYEEYLESRSGKKKDYIRIINMPPNFTMTDKLFEKLIKENTLSESYLLYIKKRCQIRNGAIKLFLEDFQMLDILSILSEEEFNLKVRKMIVARSTNDEDIVYSYQDYLDHVNQTKDFSEKHPNYKLIVTNEFNYENLEFYIQKENCVVVEKTNYPIVSIVFENERIIEAFEKEILHIIKT